MARVAQEIPQQINPEVFISEGKMRLTGSLDVTDNASGGIVHKLDSDLGNTSTRTYNPSEHILIHYSPAVAALAANIPVRPKTRVTLTSLTGTLEESMIAICRWH